MALTVRAQPGPQEKALSSAADIILLGGAKGGGKSWCLRLAAARHVGLAGYHAAIFRRSLPQIKKPGGQWDKSYELYPYMGARPNRSALRWDFPAKSTITFSHLFQDSSWLGWQGTETAFFGFDQLEEFSQNQFLKILGCARTTCGIRTQLWATMNPDADSWVRSFVDPWIAEDGYVDLAQDGQIKYFTIHNDEIIWVDPSWRDGLGQPPKSVAYFTADIWDNPALLATDPDYLASLQAQSLVDRERFLGQRGRGGNWNIKPVAGKVFQPGWFEVVPKLPPPQPSDRWVRFWDFASMEKQIKGPQPDWTAGIKLGTTSIGLVVADVRRFQETPAGVHRNLKNTAVQDGALCKQRWQRDPGQAGVDQDQALRSLLSGFDALGLLIYTSKYDRVKPASAAAEQGRIKLLAGAWIQDFLTELQGFPDGDHDDQVDGLSGAYNVLVGKTGTATGKMKV